MQQKKQESPAAGAPAVVHSIALAVAAVDPAVDPAGGDQVVTRWYILKVEHVVNLGLCLMCILYRHSEFCMGCKAAFALSAKWMTHAKTQPAAQPRDISR